MKIITSEASPCRLITSESNKGSKTGIFRLVIKVSYYSRVGLAAGVVVMVVSSRIFHCALPIARERERDIKREHNKRKKE